MIDSLRTKFFLKKNAKLWTETKNPQEKALDSVSSRIITFTSQNKNNRKTRRGGRRRIETYKTSVGMADRWWGCISVVDGFSLFSWYPLQLSFTEWKQAYFLRLSLTLALVTVLWVCTHPAQVAKPTPQGIGLSAAPHLSLLVALLNYSSFPPETSVPFGHHPPQRKGAL